MPPGGSDRHVGVVVRGASVGLRRGVVAIAKHEEWHAFDKRRGKTRAALRHQEESYFRDGGKRERCYDGTVHRFRVGATTVLDS